MFQIKKIENKTLYYSDILNTEHFFTTREIEIKETSSEPEEMIS